MRFKYSVKHGNTIKFVKHLLKYEILKKQKIINYCLVSSTALQSLRSRWRRGREGRPKGVEGAETGRHTVVIIPHPVK